MSSTRNGLSGAGAIALLKVPFFPGHGNRILKSIKLASGGKFQAVASSVHRFDEAGLAWIGLEFGAQVTNVNPDGFDVVIRLVSPDLFENQRRGHGLAMTLEETVKEFEFEVGQSNRAVEPDRFEAFRNEGERAVTEDFVVIAGSNGCPVAAA